MTTNERSGDPFDALATPIERQEPRTSFRRDLRRRLVDRLDLDPHRAFETPATIDLPERKKNMSTGTVPITASAVTPYLTAHDADAALDWYAEAFGAVEQLRIPMDDGGVGHAEFHIGEAVFYVSDEAPDLGVLSPHTLGGTSSALHLQVGDVDAVYGRAVAAGATAQRQPADQPHGARHGVLVDPFGHRWMLSQPIATDNPAKIPGTSDGETIVAADRPGTGGGIWAGVFYDDALAGIRFLVDTFGFEEQIVVTAPDDTTVVHSQLRWPEGGIVQAGTADPDNVFTHPPGGQSLYVVTADPHAVWERCRAAGLEVVRPPEEPDHDPGGMGFSVRDPEGNIWSFGTYGG